MCVGLLCTYHIIPIQLSRRARARTHTHTHVARVYVCVHGCMYVCTGIFVFARVYVCLSMMLTQRHVPRPSSTITKRVVALSTCFLKKKSFLKTRTAALITHHQESRLINFQFSRRHAAQKKMGIEIIPHSCSS